MSRGFASSRFNRVIVVAVARRHISLGLSLPRQYALIGMLLIAPALLIFLMVIAYPLGYAVYLSFFSIYTPTLQGEWGGLGKYQAMLTSSEFWTSLSTTILWTIGTLSLQIVLGVTVALLLNLDFYQRPLA